MMQTATVSRKPIISADSHIAEPANMYDGRLPKKYVDLAPKMTRRPQGGDVYSIPGMDDFPITMASAAGKRGKELAAQVFANFDDCHRGAWDPKQRLVDQDRDGISGEILYPSLGMFLCNHDDFEYKAALFRAYNEWLAEYTSAAPTRLFGLGQTALATPEQGIRDLQEMKAFGLYGAMLPGYPGQEDYDSRIYDPFWETAVGLGLPVTVHVLTYKDGLGKPRGPKLNSFISTIRGNQDVIGTLIFGGVFERFPGLKFVCAEADAGWAPHYMQRLDHALERSPHWLGDVTLSRKPSEYFRENVYLSFQDDLTAFKLKDFFNVDRMLWANDFPHFDSTWPWSQDLLTEHTAALSDGERDKMLHDNVSSLYGLPI